MQYRKGDIMFKKKLLLSLLSLTLGASLIAGNVVYASGNPAESHDSTSPLRRVQDMEYSSDTTNTISFYSADASQGSGHSTCSECQKQVHVQEHTKHPVSHKVHHTHKGHHAKHQNKSHR